MICFNIIILESVIGCHSFLELIKYSDNRWFFLYNFLSFPSNLLFFTSGRIAYAVDVVIESDPLFGNERALWLCVLTVQYH